ARAYTKHAHLLRGVSEFREGLTQKTRWRGGKLDRACDHFGVGHFSRRGYETVLESGALSPLFFLRKRRKKSGNEFPHSRTPRGAFLPLRGRTLTSSRLRSTACSPAVCAGSRTTAPSR